ncbi:MAG TPA: 3-deoxy-7-phosphoheptulonate synthase [Oscillospiraceae bacterium]|nr:3-deoxy-7-phosphoheptulonate synthase [Oscillospiraceae bacterium]
MVVVLKKGTTDEQLENLVSWLKTQGVEPDISRGTDITIVGLVGDVSHIDTELIEALDIVESVKRVSEPFKAANRKFHPDDTVVTLENGTRIGGGNFVYMAGPCSVESEAQIIGVARRVKAAGAQILRGGAFKPRTSPYSFQGMGEEGIRLLMEAKRETGLPVVTELMDVGHLDAFDGVDIIQIGARNMQNYELLKEMGHVGKPVLLKRGLANTIQEWLMSAEYILAGGNRDVILCERGIRTCETYTRNTLDLSAVAVVHGLSHLPVIVDPSHATGVARLVTPMALGAAAVGADGLMVEVHNDPPHAKCDGAQSLTPDQFDLLTAKVAKVREAVV